MSADMTDQCRSSADVGPTCEAIWDHASGHGGLSDSLSSILVLSQVYSKQPIFRLTQEWFRELYCGVHNKLHISSADWWDVLLPLAQTL